MTCSKYLQVKWSRIPWCGTEKSEREIITCVMDFHTSLWTYFIAYERILALVHKSLCYLLLYIKVGLLHLKHKTYIWCSSMRADYDQSHTYLFVDLSRPFRALERSWWICCIRWHELSLFNLSKNSISAMVWKGIVLSTTTLRGGFSKWSSQVKLSKEGSILNNERTIKIVHQTLSTEPSVQLFPWFSDY